MRKYDLVVVGGGFSGVAAAVAAAREGVKVLLIEKNGMLGGAASNALVNPFMSYNLMEGGVKKAINNGIFVEILGRLREMNGLAENGFMFNEECLKVVLDRLCSGSGVGVLLHTALVDAAVNEGRISSITVAGVSGLKKIEADCYLDCTGDANLAAFSGCSFQLGREIDNLCQPMTLCFRVGNVNIDTKKYAEKRKEINELYKEFRSQGKIKNPREDVLVFQTMNNGVLHFNTTRIINKNPTDEWDLSAAEADAREQVLEILGFMKENVSGFENACLLHTAPEIGIRESRKIDGEYRITADDILGCKKFEDAIACGVYCIDIHNPNGTGTVIKRITPGNYYTIPYRSLIPVGISNLLVAGRCISSTHEAQSAYRIMPIVCCIGQSAGLAAALFGRGVTDFRDIEISALHGLCKKQNLRYN